MADAVPSSLQQADASIYKTAKRAEQLAAVKPIVAYWCDYWVLKQILSKGLHNTHPELLEYSSRLMDKMEQVKDTHTAEDAITDDVAGQAYIEQFAQETLDRAQRVVKANKVTATTAHTFDAAATFFGLVNIWGTPDAETLQKIKYAKWNTARIFKAIKEGSDPNASNPNPEDLPPQDVPEKDDNALAADSPNAPNAPRPVTVEDVSEGADEMRPRRDSAGVSLPHSPVSVADVPPSVPGAVPGTPPLQDPLDLPSAPAFDASAPVSLPSVPTDFAASPPAPSTAHVASTLPPTFAPSPQTTAAIAPPPAAPPAAAPYSSYTASPPPSQPAFVQPSGYPPTTVPVARTVPQPPAPPAGPSAAGASAERPYRQPPATVDDVAIAAAQKHAKWAISALNFEDVNTAVRELRKALETLGAS